MALTLCRRYTQAPLPFIGQKRRFLAHFIDILHQLPDKGKGYTIVDVFGGSGLLAHTAKRILPKSTVIYNDFDGYAHRLECIDDTNRLRRLLFDILHDKPRSIVIDQATHAQIATLLKNFNGFVDVQSIAGWLLFSGAQASNLDDLLSQRLYNRIKKHDYPSAKGYLDNLIITHDSFEITCTKHQDNPKALLVLDPPYVCTAQNAYANAGYFGMTKFLTLMHYVRPPYVFFSSTRSELLDYMDYAKTYEPKNFARFGGYRHIAIQAILNKTAKYEDNILYKL